MSRHRLLLYGIAAVSASALLWAGFIRKVDADPGTLVRSAETVLQAVQAMPESIDGAPNALRARLLAEAEADLARALRAVQSSASSEAAGGDDDAVAFILECQAFARYLAGDRQAAIECYRQAAKDPGSTIARKRSIEITIVKILIGGGRPVEALRSLDSLSPSGRPPDEVATLEILRAEALLMAGASIEELQGPLRRAATLPEATLASRVRCAEIYDRLGLRAEALGVLERAAADEEEARYPLARLKFRSGDVDGAIMTLETLARKDPAGLRAWLERHEMSALLERLEPSRAGDAGHQEQ